MSEPKKKIVVRMYLELDIDPVPERYPSDVATIEDMARVEADIACDDPRFFVDVADTRKVEWEIIDA